MHAAGEYQADIACPGREGEESPPESPQKAIAPGGPSSDNLG